MWLPDFAWYLFVVGGGERLVPFVPDLLLAGRVGAYSGIRIAGSEFRVPSSKFRWPHGAPVAGFPSSWSCPERAWGRILQAIVRGVKMFAGLKCFITFASPKESSFKFAPARS